MTTGAAGRTLRLQDVHAYYGDGHVLQGIDLEVPPGQLVCMFGRNGAGKTTTVRTIIGLTRARRGRITLGDLDLTGMTPERVARAGVGLVPQGRQIFPDLSVRENLLFAARPGPWTLDRVHATFPRLKDRERNRGDELSGGEQQMLSIARALLMNSSLILMDEPSAGLAPLILREIRTIILQMKGEGLSVLLVEQNLALGLSVADRCYVLNKGTIVHESTPEALAANETIKHRYLGV